MVVVAPRTRARDGVRAHAPATVVPVRADRAEHTIHIPDVEEVVVSVREERAALAVLLRLHEREDLGERGLGLFLATQRGDDGAVNGRTGELPVLENRSPEHKGFVAMTAEIDAFSKNKDSIANNRIRVNIWQISQILGLFLGLC